MASSSFLITVLKSASSPLSCSRGSLLRIAVNSTTTTAAAATTSITVRTPSSSTSAVSSSSAASAAVGARSVSTTTTCWRRDEQATVFGGIFKDDARRNDITYALSLASCPHNNSSSRFEHINDEQKTQLAISQNQLRRAIPPPATP